MRKLPSTALLFWVYILGLPLNNLTTQNAQTIGNFLEHFLEVDPSTLSTGTSHSLRIRTFIPLDKVFITGFHSKRNYGTIHGVTFKYEPMLDIYFNCGFLGHFCSSCPNPRHTTDVQSTRKHFAFGPWMKINSPRKDKPTTSSQKTMDNTMTHYHAPGVLKNPSYHDNRLPSPPSEVNGCPPASFANKVAATNQPTVGIERLNQYSMPPSFSVFTQNP